MDRAIGADRARSYQSLQFDQPVLRCGLSSARPPGGLCCRTAQVCTARRRASRSPCVTDARAARWSRRSHGDWAGGGRSGGEHSGPAGVGSGGVRPSVAWLPVGSPAVRVAVGLAGDGEGVAEPEGRCPGFPHGPAAGRLAEPHRDRRYGLSERRGDRRRCTRRCGRNSRRAQRHEMRELRHRRAGRWVVPVRRRRGEPGAWPAGA